MSGPYSFLGPRPFREARIRAYFVREHRRGRPIAAILEDAYVSRCGSELAWRVLCRPETISALGGDVVHELEALRTLHAAG
jgi:hypothetical protein